ncbi:MAG: ATP-binding protein [Patescibacteria group bacterium]|nr:ATP-binding protein [Patescibacteria group bacterium]
MIHSFSCKNFYSFSDLTTVDFAVNDKAPVNNGYFTASSGNRLSKIETVVGPNASGKTNLLKVLPFLKWLITDSFNINPSALLPVKPFMFGEQKNKPTELSADFEINGDIYTYTFVLDEKKIISEEMKVKNKTNQKETSKKVFSRQWNNESGKYELDDKRFNLPKEFENSMRPNASILSVAVRFNHKESQEIFKYWQKIETNVTEAGWVGDHLLPNKIPQWFEALIFYSDNETLKKEAEKLLSRFDLGLNGIVFEKEKAENGLTIKNVQAVHLFNGKEQFLPILYESSGTKQLFTILKTILQALNNGSIAIVDEFDVNLHPEMVMALLDLFIQPETNPKNAQLLMSTHSHILLSKLDKYQIILVEKNKNGMSESWRLDDVSGVRADDNYYTKYIAGAYGAVPKL